MYEICFAKYLPVVRRSRLRHLDFACLENIINILPMSPCSNAAVKMDSSTSFGAVGGIKMFNYILQHTILFRKD